MSVLEAIGNTPLVEIKRLWNSEKTQIRIFSILLIQIYKAQVNWVAFLIRLLL